MFIDLIRIAIESSVASITPEIDTAWENVPYTPVQGIDYQEVFLKLVPYNPVYGTEVTTRYNGLLYIRIRMANIPLRVKGTKPLTDRASLLLEKFKIGSSHIKDAVECIVDETPVFNTEGIESDRFKGLFVARFFTNLL